MVNEDPVGENEDAKSKKTLLEAEKDLETSSDDEIIDTSDMTSLNDSE